MAESPVSYTHLDVYKRQVQTLCMKLGYELCRPIPELLQEYKTLLDLAEPDLLQISLRTVRKNILNKIR